MRISKAAATIAAVALASGLTAAALAATHQASTQLAADTKPAVADPSLGWLASVGGKAQVTFNYESTTSPPPWRSR